MPRPAVPLDPAALLDLVPVKNGAIRQEERGTRLVLWVPLRRRWWMGPPIAWILPFRSEKGVELDAIGQQVFGACDGTRTTEQIIEEFAARHRLRFHEARLSVLSFLRSLAERKLVALVGSKNRRA
jgi:hypothetical protein